MDENLERFVQLFSELLEYIEESIQGFISWWNEFYDSLEPYERFEMLHPRKKPRGSMRRERREKRKHET